MIGISSIEAQWRGAYRRRR